MFNLLGPKFCLNRKAKSECRINASFVSCPVFNASNASNKAVFHYYLLIDSVFSRVKSHSNHGFGASIMLPSLILIKFQNAQLKCNNKLFKCNYMYLFSSLYRITS